MSNNQTIGQDDSKEQLEKKIKEKEAVIREHEGRLSHLQSSGFQLGNFYLVFQGVILTALANSTKVFTCNDSWLLILLSVLGACPNLVALYLIGQEYNRTISQRHKCLLRCDQLNAELSTRCNAGSAQIQPSPAAGTPPPGQTPAAGGTPSPGSSAGTPPGSSQIQSSPAAGTPPPGQTPAAGGTPSPGSSAGTPPGSSAGTPPGSSAGTPPPGQTPAAGGTPSPGSSAGTPPGSSAGTPPGSSAGTPPGSSAGTPPIVQNSRPPILPVQAPARIRGDYWKKLKRKFCLYGCMAIFLGVSAIMGLACGKILCRAAADCKIPPKFSDKCIRLCDQGSKCITICNSYHIFFF